MTRLSPLYAVERTEITEVREHYDLVYESIHTAGGALNWQYPTPESQIERYIDSKRLHAVRYAGELAATGCLDITPGIRDTAGAPYLPGFLTISRLAAFKGSSPRGAGAHFLQAAEQWAMEQNVSLSVLFCSTTNEQLQAYYTSQDYAAYGPAENREQRPAWLSHIPSHPGTTLFAKLLEYGR